MHAKEYFSEMSRVVLGVCTVVIDFAIQLIFCLLSFVFLEYSGVVDSSSTHYIVGSMYDNLES